MKKIFFLSVLAGTIILGGVLGYSIWKVSPRTAQDFVKSGKEYYEAKQYPEAIIQFLNAIQKDPRNREAGYLLADAYINAGDLNQAARRLISLLEYYPDDVEASLKLGGVYVASGRNDPKLFRDALEIAEKLLAKKPQNVEALVLKGNSLAGVRDYDASMSMFEEALKLDPQNAGIMVDIGVTQAAQKNFADAEAAFIKARQLDPKNKNALLSLANYYRAVNKNDNAEAVYREGFALDPSDKKLYLALASLYFREGRVDQVDRILKEAQDKNPSDPTPSLALASFYNNQNRSADSANVLFELKKKFSENMEVAIAIIEAVMTSQPDRAQSEIDQIRKANPKNPVGILLLARLQFSKGQLAAAETTIQKELGNTSMPAAEYLLGQIADARGNLDLAQTHYQKSLQLNAGYLASRLGLAEVFFKQGSFKEARTEVKRVLDAQPNSIGGLLLQASLDTIDRKYDDAEKTLTTLLKADPNNGLFHLRMGLYQQARGQSAAAEKSLLRALELLPDSMEAVQALSGFYAAQRRTDRALQILNSVPENKRKVGYYDLLGQLYAQMGKLKEVEEANKKALQLDPARASSRGYLAGLYIQTGRLDEAVQQIDELLKDNPSNPSALSLRGMVLTFKGDKDGAKDSYIRALKANPEFFLAANNLANILADEGHDMEGALKWAQTARRSVPDDVSGADTLGWIQHKLGQNLLARDQLQFAVSKEPENPIYQYHLAVIYKETKQTAQAEAALRKLLKGKNNFEDKKAAEALLAELTGTKRP